MEAVSDQAEWVSRARHRDNQFNWLSFARVDIRAKTLCGLSRRHEFNLPIEESSEGSVNVNDPEI